MKYNLKKKSIIAIIFAILTVVSILLNKFNLSAKQNIHANNNAEQTQKPLNYLFVASWSPAYCAEKDPQGYQTQCHYSLKKKYRFIVHGLWPQQTPSNEKTPLLNYCKNVSSELTGSLVDTYFYLMPSSKLMKHQWVKHGSCGDFTINSYFERMEKLYNQFHINTLFSDIKTTQSMALKTIIDKSINHIPNIKAENIIVKCKKNVFKELRICLNADFMPRKCDFHEVKRGACRKNQKIIIKL